MDTETKEKHLKAQLVACRYLIRGMADATRRLRLSEPPGEEREQALQVIHGIKDEWCLALEALERHSRLDQPTFTRR